MLRVVGHGDENWPGAVGCEADGWEGFWVGTCGDVLIVRAAVRGGEVWGPSGSCWPCRGFIMDMAA